ncbi:GNAT family N-acetyltransferase [Methylomonas sp. LWB]|uniref:GNAT family N-acetyltransferase n=1 Tax=unclassified Methylomonas TaxID=2608980 RepID=UPI0008DABB8E|nr:GNAT family N-acetyltransferase [Methylomonas sp. LWB]OHX34885.1 GNAT family N-acetyltransferase [Methylomonas sp. LWB]
MRIDLARAADIAVLSDLLTELFDQEAEFCPDSTAQQRGLAAIIGDPTIGEILVAREDGRPVGMVSLLYTVSTALGGRVAWLEDMVVTANRRGSGIGQGLLKAAIAHAKSGGCRRITLLTDAENAAAQDFYRREGFNASPMRPYRLSLE